MRKTTVYIIFGVYLLVLIKLILFKYPLHMINDMLVNNDLELLRRRLYVSNYLPFKTIWNYSKNIGWGVSQ